MVVQQYLKKNGKLIGMIIDGKSYTISDCLSLYSNGYLSNVIVTKDGKFKSKCGKIPIQEVENNVKRNESSLGQVSRPEFRSGRCNKGGSSSSENRIRESRREKVNSRGAGSPRTTTGCRFGESQVSSRRTLQSIPLRLNELGCKVYSKSNPKTFHNEFHNAKLAQKNGACVDEHSLEDLSKMKLLRSDNGFVAIENDGNINSVLRDVRKPKTENFLRDLILNAISNGGTKLDCFAIIVNNQKGGLAKMYCKYGFIPVVKDHFNREFAPDNWDYERDGEPDVVFMYHCGDSLETVIKKSSKNEYKAYLDYDVPYITDLPRYYKEPPEDYDWDLDKDDLSTYSQAKRYRDWVVQNKLKYKS